MSATRGRRPASGWVVTATDLDGEIAGPIPSMSKTPPFDIGRRDGGDAADPSQYPLARERVRYAGEPVAFVVADTIAQAQDAAELIAVDYTPLPAVMEIEDALDPAAEQIWPDAPGNVTFDWATGDAARRTRPSQPPRMSAGCGWTTTGS